MRKTLLLVLSFWGSSLFAQDIPDSIALQINSINIQRIDAEIIPDGKLEESVWEQAESSSPFWQTFPYDTSGADGQTEVLMLRDDDFLYIGVICRSTGNDFVTPSLRRDYSFPGSDNVSLVFDTYNDKTNAFMFGLNPFGVQREALIANGGRQFGDFQSSWDNKWFGDAQVYENYWTAEFAIPFKTLRYTEGSTKWRFNCYRSDTQHNEWSTWNRIPRNRLIMDLSFMGDMKWDEPLKKPGTNISIIPYAITSLERGFDEQNPDENMISANAGADAKIAVTSGLNLDLTLNTDFSQVEVDQQVTNLTRFEVFLPERRQFFLENADLFNSFGLRLVNPFFSRRIGVVVDTTTGSNIQNSIVYGARLSGKLNENLRVGLLNMQSAKEEENGLPGFNFTVAALQQKVFNRSNVSFIFVNKEAINGEDNSTLYNKYNRVAGLEYRLASADNRWTGKTFAHLVFTPEEVEHKFTHGFQLEYLRRKYRFEWAHLLIGNGFNAEVGFVPRKDFFLMSPEGQWFFYPDKGIVNQHNINVDSRFYLQIGKDGNVIIPDWGLSEWQIEMDWEFQFKNNTRGTLNATYDNITLLDDFDPTRIQEEGIVLPAASSYKFVSFEAEYTSDQRKKFFVQMAPRIGQFFNGFRAGFSGEITYRYQPYGFISMAYDYNYIRLGGAFKPANLWLIGPRIDLTFSKKVFLTTFIQYNSQFDNLNINTRFQWRFAPVSDFFLVYTDNYLTDSFSQFGLRNRSLVAKVTYWLNL